MKIKDAVVLVTGANRGLGQAFVHGLLAAGAKKIYAAARKPESITLDGVEPIRLDVTKPGEITAAVAIASDVNLLINNAGISSPGALLSKGSLAAARAEFETNFFGPLAMSTAFAPVLAANGGGTIVNVLSVLSWISFPGAATYSASKAAEWSLTNGLRHELRSQGTKVMGVHVAFMDTDMTKGREVPKVDPNDVARLVLEALETDQDEVLADDLTRKVKQGLSAGFYLAEPKR